MGQIISVANQKGGVGKTTTALTLAAAFSDLGKKILVIDLDPHACATIHLAIFPEGLNHTAEELFISENVDEDFWQQVIIQNANHNFDLIPSSVSLADLEGEMKGRPGKGLILKERLQGIREDYDFIIIDCPPQVGVLLINALVATDLLIIPIQTDFLALQGLKLIFQTMGMLNKALPYKIKYKGLATMYDRRAGACRRVLRLLKNKMGDHLFETVINTDTNFREASAKGKVIMDVAPESRGALEYAHLAKEIVHL